MRTWLLGTTSDLRCHAPHSHSRPSSGKDLCRAWDIGIVAQRAIMQPRGVDKEIVKRGLRTGYLAARSDHTSRLIDGYAALLARFHRHPMVVHDLVQEAASFLQRQFRLRWVMIGQKSPDGLFRYEAMSGVRPEVWEKQSARTYTKEEFAPEVKGFFTAAEISRLTRVYLEEDNPLGEEDMAKINRPILLKSRRRSQEDALEGDFLDTMILNSDNDLLGWIDYSGTVTGKFADPMTIRWVELMSAVLGAAISTQQNGSNRAQKEVVRTGDGPDHSDTSAGSPR